MSKTEKTKSLKKGERVAGVATLVALAYALAKGVIGYLSGSIALIADAYHTSADSLATFASWFGLKISQRKPDERFTYGYYKGETLATLFVCVLILYAGIEVLLESYSKLFLLSELAIPQWALGISLISAITYFFMARYMERVGKGINSQSLITNAQESKMNVLASTVVFAGVLCSYFKVPYIEGGVGILLSLLLLQIGLANGKVALFSLMDVSPSREIENKAKEVITSISGVEDFEDLKLRRAGPYIFGEAKVKVRKFVDVGTAHEISENIEKKIKEEIGQIDSFTIHIEPFKTRKQKLVIPIKNNDGLKSKIVDHFGRANHFIFITLEENKVQSHYIKDNPHKTKKVRAGLFAAHDITKDKVDLLITRQMGEISFHSLRGHLVDIYLTKQRIVEDAVDDYVNEKLQRLSEPTRKIGTEQIEAEETTTKIKEKK